MLFAIYEYLEENPSNAEQQQRQKKLLKQMEPSVKLRKRMLAMLNSHPVAPQRERKNKINGVARRLRKDWHNWMVKRPRTKKKI